MDQPLKSPGQSALDDTFHRLFELSRSEPAATLEQRLDRLARLRAVVADNEARFEAAISADFGHRCATETLFAEQIFVLGEIKHTARHLKKWMAPRRIATALQFMPARNRLIPQPLGVVGIIAPWNYPLQLTLAPAIGALAAGNRVMIKPSELTPITLELGGKSPAIVDLNTAAERIASGTGAYHGEWGFRELSKLKPVFYRSPLNRLADLYPPYGSKIARLQKMLRLMS